MTTVNRKNSATANTTANNTNTPIQFSTSTAFKSACRVIEQENGYAAMILSEMANMVKTTGESLASYEEGYMPITEKLVWTDEVLPFWNDFERQIISIANGLYSGEEFEEESFADWFIENIKKFMSMLQFFPKWIIEVKPHKKRIVDWFNLATN